MGVLCGSLICGRCCIYGVVFLGKVGFWDSNLYGV